MRRSDREITDPERIEAFVRNGRIIRIAFWDRGEIYIVPVNYGYEKTDGQYRFYFHGAKAGRKYELSGSSPSVGFEIDGGYRLLEAETACGYSAEFWSVTGTGTIRLLEDPEEKIRGLDLLMGQASGKMRWDYPTEALDRVAVYRLDAEKLSCKARAGRSL